jgi:hypothetical protein
VFPMDEDCMGLAITLQVSVMFWALVFEIIADGAT